MTNNGHIPPRRDFAAFSRSIDRSSKPGGWIYTIGAVLFWALMVAGISGLIYALFIMPGCKSGGVFNLFGGGMPDAPKPRGNGTNGLAITNGIFAAMAWMLIPGGLITLGVAIAFKIDQLKHFAIAVALGGAACAVVPALFEIIGMQLKYGAWAAVIIASVFGLYWLTLKGWRMWKHRNNGHCKGVAT
jgi:hypothetical protein